MARTVSNLKLISHSGSRNITATWYWKDAYTQEFSIYWYYAIGDGVWHIGAENATVAYNATAQQYTHNYDFDAPENAYCVQICIKPISKTHTVNKKETSYWTASWSPYKKLYLSNAPNPPSVPPVPTVTVDKYTIKAECSTHGNSATQIEFYILDYDAQKKYKSIKATVNKVSERASIQVDGEAGKKYSVCARGVKGNDTSEWTEYSSPVLTIPSTPVFQSLDYWSIWGEVKNECYAVSATSAKLFWTKIISATEYVLEYTTNLDYFKYNSGQIEQKTVEENETLVTGLAAGNWYFRVKARNEQGDSAWSEIISIPMGTAPNIPTTWSSASTASVGDTITLFWVHNASDGSRETSAKLNVYVDDVLYLEREIPKEYSEDNYEPISFYELDTSPFSDGAKITWKVQTKAFVDTYSEFSVLREIDVYAPPTITLNTSLIPYFDDETVSDILDRYPFNISINVGPENQNAIRAFVSIQALSAYEAFDDTGSPISISEGSIIYSKSQNAFSNSIDISIGPGDAALFNNQRYLLICSVAMDSGLIAEASQEFTVEWTEDEYYPNAEISIDEETIAAYITPYAVLAEDPDTRSSDVYLSVFRREFDGSFTEIASMIDSESDITVVDPHPALNYARYRIVAISKTTGVISYSDLPGIPVGEIFGIIQWDEEWSEFDYSGESPAEVNAWSGSMVKLKWNLDVSDNHAPDVALIEYIGRTHPVSYFGTQKGETSTWNTDVDKNDEETIYALRRLAAYNGNCYVREPSGTGYWASVTVSFTNNHSELVVPVTLSIARVEGGA